MSEASRLVCLQNEQTRAVELAEESIALWRQVNDNDPCGLAMALLHRGWAAHAMGDYQLAKRMYLEGIQHVSPTCDTWLHAQLLFYLAAAAGFTSDFQQMSMYYYNKRQASAASLFDDSGFVLLR